MARLSLRQKFGEMLGMAGTALVLGLVLRTGADGRVMVVQDATVEALVEEGKLVGKTFSKAFGSLTQAVGEAEKLGSRNEEYMAQARKDILSMYLKGNRTFERLLKNSEGPSSVANCRGVEARGHGDAERQCVWEVAEDAQELIVTVGNIKKGLYAIAGPGREGELDQKVRTHFERLDSCVGLCEEICRRAEQETGWKRTLFPEPPGGCPVEVQQ